MTPAAPAITQSSGSTYDIYICQALVNSSGAVTVTDERTIAQVTAADIANAAVTADKLAAAVAGDGLTGGAGTALAVGAGTAITVAANSVGVTPGGIGTTQLATNSVDDTIVGNRVPMLTNRQGNSATVWGGTSGAGATNYVPTAVKMQVGMAGATISGSSGSFNVTYPVAFSNVPVALLTPGNPLYSVAVVPVIGSATAVFELFWKTVDGSSVSSAAFTCAWLAIGPE